LPFSNLERVRLCCLFSNIEQDTRSDTVGFYARKKEYNAKETDQLFQTLQKLVCCPIAATIALAFTCMSCFFLESCDSCIRVGYSGPCISLFVMVTLFKPVIQEGTGCVYAQRISQFLVQNWQEDGK
jgi:hypothetical protein